MRILSAIFIAIALGSAAVLCYSLQRGLTYEQPRLQIDPLTHNMGEIGQGRTVDVTFRLKNFFDKTLYLDRAWAPCSCTTPKLESELLRPGESTTLKTSWNTRSLRGEQGTEVVLNYHLDENTPQVAHLRITAVVKPGLQATPSPIRVDPHSDAVIGVKIRDLKGSRYDTGPVKGVVMSHKAFRLREFDGEGFQMSIDRDLISEVGSMPFVTVITNDPNDPQLRIPIVVGSD